MENLTCIAPAKVNFFLRIGRRESNNLHKIQSLFRKISVFDKISFRITEGECSIKVFPGSFIKGTAMEGLLDSISNSDNILFKAAGKFFMRAGLKGAGIEIFLEKNIPFNAGLGGGSSDAASLLSALNAVYGGKLTVEELKSIAQEVGSDVPFFLIEESSALVSGFGDEIKPVPDGSLPGYSMVVVMPDFGIGTKEAYAALDDFILTKNANYYNIQYLDFLDLSGFELANDFENVIFEKYPLLKEIRDSLVSAGAEISLLSGSGSAIFGAFGREEDARGYLNDLNGLKKFRFSDRVVLSFLAATL